MRKIVFIVDDSKLHLSVIEGVLKEHYDIVPISSAKAMYVMLEQLRIKPHLILIDIGLPEEDGFAALEWLKSKHEYDYIPVMFLTSVQKPEIEAKGFEMGVVDFIQKPISPPVLLNRVKLQLSIADIISERTARLRGIQQGMIYILSNVLESRDEITGTHIARTTEYVRILVQGMIENGVYVDDLKKWDMEMLTTYTLLHDVGKVAVSDAVLNKKGKLTEEEYDEMKTHTVAGKWIIERIIERTGMVDFLTHVKLFAVSHHENWDGTGYPEGLRGEDIPIEGRIMAVADVYDALTSARSYKVAFSNEKAVEIIMSEVGHRFDPKIAEVFYKIRDRFEREQIRLVEEAEEEIAYRASAIHRSLKNG